MEIGINTACLQKKSTLSAFELLDFTLENGFRFIEFRDEYPFFENINTRERESLRNDVESAGIQCSVHLPFYDLNIGSFRRVLRDSAVKSHCDSVQKAAEIGASYVTIHGGKMSRSFYRHDQMSETDKYSSESIAIIRETCAKLGITLCVENMSVFESGEYKSFTHPEHLINLYSQQENEIKITFDFGHAVSVIPKPELFAERLGVEKIAFGHLSDNNFIKDQHKAVGDGDIDYRSFLETYLKEQWEFPLLIETQTRNQALASKKYLEDLCMKIRSS